MIATLDFQTNNHTEMIIVKSRKDTVMIVKRSHQITALSLAPEVYCKLLDSFISTRLLCIRN